jgi:excisionase family DNA binding protein
MVKPDKTDTMKKGAEYMTPAQVAELLQVTRRTVYGWIKGGKLKAYSAGGTVRIRRDDIEAFIKPVEPGGGQVER